MNCKRGDLAVLIRSNSGNEGRIVRCVVLEKTSFSTEPLNARGITMAWRVDEPFHSLGGICTHIPDDYLRPIRDNDGEDEILRIAGKPATEFAHG